MSERDEQLRELETQMAVVLQRLRKVIQRRAHDVDPTLSGAAYLILSFLLMRGPSRSSEVVVEFDIDKGAISRQVQQLVDLGLVIRETDPADGRASLLVLPESTKERLWSLSSDRRAALDAHLGDWSDEDLAQFCRRLGEYNAAVALTV